MSKNTISKTPPTESLEAQPLLDTLRDRLDKANAYAGEILRRAERTNDRLFAQGRDGSDEEDIDADDVHIGAIETIGYQITYLMDLLSALDTEVRTTGGL